jgi:hypothetical protein
MSYANPYYWSAHWLELRAACCERAGGMCEAPQCTRRGVIADHIITRPNTPQSCEYDRLDNLRWLCRSHDAEVKERAGQRKQGGAFKIRGCDAEGWPLDPARRAR